jgi:hypothetical protein
MTPSAAICILVLVCLSAQPAGSQNALLPSAVIDAGWGSLSGGSSRMLGLMGQSFPGSARGGSAMVQSGLLSELELIQPTTGVEPASLQAPGAFELLQNYPNPFNPTTTIRFSVGSASGQGQADGRAQSPVRLSVYDLLGRRVAVLVDESRQPGIYSTTWNATGMATGIYFCRMEAGQFVATMRMLLLK